MSTMIGLRTLNRSAKIGVGAKDASPTKTTWANVDNPRVARDLARHATLGQIFQSQPARYQIDTARVEGGGVVTPRTASLTLDVGAGALTYVGLAPPVSATIYVKGSTASWAAGTQAVTPDAATPLLTAIGLNTSTPATPTIVALAGTTLAAVTEDRSLNALASLAAAQVPDFTAADRTWLALVWTPPTLGTITGVAATGVFTKAAHGFNVGDPVWFNAVTGATAGLSTGVIYYVNTVPTSGTFTVSATLGGPTLLWTTNVTAGSAQRQILAQDVVDIRP